MNDRFTKRWSDDVPPLTVEDLKKIMHALAPITRRPERMPVSASRFNALYRRWLRGQLAIALGWRKRGRHT